MPEIIAQFPISTEQPSVIGGQIFAVHLPSQQLTRQPLEEQHPEMAGVETRLQEQILEELGVFQHATAALLLRRLRYSPNSYRHIQKQIHALLAEKPENRFVEINPTPKR